MKNDDPRSIKLANHLGCWAEIGLYQTF
jgi:hypothetical protein